MLKPHQNSFLMYFNHYSPGPFTMAITIENMSICFSALSFLLSRTDMTFGEFVHRVIYSVKPLILLLIVTGNAMKKEVTTIFLHSNSKCLKCLKLNLLAKIH